MQIDRMRHPVSHTAAIVAAVSFMALFIEVFWFVLDPRAARSTTFLQVLAVSAAVFVAALVAYFKPSSGAALLTLALTSAILLALCVWYGWGAWLRYDGATRARELIKVGLFLSAWFAWTGHKLSRWRAERRGAAQ